MKTLKELEIIMNKAKSDFEVTHAVCRDALAADFEKDNSESHSYFEWSQEKSMDAYHKLLHAEVKYQAVLKESNK